MTILACALSLGLAREASAEWTLAVFVGGARTRDTSLTLAQPAEGTSVTLSPVRYDSASLDAPIYYGYRVGFFPRSGWFGVEAEFIHLKVIADTGRMTNVEGLLRGQPVGTPRPLAQIIQRFSITHGVNLLLFNAVVRRQGAASSGDQPRWTLSGRFGAGASIPHPESTLDGVTLERYEWGAFGIEGAAGTEVRLGGPVYILGEYKLTRTVQNVAIARGSARTPLVTHHLVAGLAVHLPARKPAP